MGQIITGQFSVSTAQKGDKGDDGNPGENSVRLDLSNGADLIACDANGKVRFARTITTVAKIYDGSNVAPIVDSVSSITLNVTRGSSTVNVASRGVYNNGVTFTFAFQAGDVLSATSYPKDITITYKGSDYTSTFKIVRTDASAIFQLYPSKTEIAFTVDGSNNWVPASGVGVSCGYTKDTGSGIESYPGTVQANTYNIDSKYNIFYRYIDNNGAYVGSWSWAKDMLTVIVPADTTNTALEYVLSTATGMASVADSNIIDRETIPIVKSGKKGGNGQAGKNANYEEREYRNYDSKATSGGVPSGSGSGSWSSSIPAYTMYFPYLWFRARQHTFDASNTETIGDWSYGLMTQPGAQGATGKWYEYAGVWGVDVSSVTNTATLGKYVKYGENFYMNIWTDEQANTTTPSNDGTHWSQMTGDREYYMAKAFFGDYAQFGSAIINADWMISRYGMVNGVRKTDGSYELFDPLCPTNEETVLFDMTLIVRSNTQASAVDVSFDMIANRSYKLYIKGGNVKPTTVTTRSMSVSVKRKIDNVTIATKTFTGASITTEILQITPTASGEYYITANTNASTVTGELRGISVTSSGNFVPNYALDMKTGRAYLNDVYARGDVIASKLMAEDDSFYTEIRPGVTNWVNKTYPLAMISIGVDSKGMFLKMTDKDGSLIWDISTDGNGKITTGGGSFTPLKYKKMSSVSPSVSEFINIRESDCTTYYQYEGSYTISNGVKIWNTGEEAKNGIVHTSTTSSDPSTNVIANGYYAKPNNGEFITDNDGKREIRLYQYSSGKLAGTLRIKF